MHFLSSMGKSEEKMTQAPSFLFTQNSDNKHNSKKEEQHEWMMIMDGHHMYNNTSSFDGNSTTTTTDDDDGSICSSSSSSSLEHVDDNEDDDDDASSKSNSGPLFELSELMQHLPIKRGLSSFYQGKSESFTSLSGVISIEDVPKRRKIFKATSKSYGNGLDVHKPIITKKVPRSCLSSLSFSSGRSRRRGGSFFTSSRPPPVPPGGQKEF